MKNINYVFDGKNNILSCCICKFVRSNRLLMQAYVTYKSLKSFIMIDISKKNLNYEFLLSYDQLFLWSVYACCNSTA